MQLFLKQAARTLHTLSQYGYLCTWEVLNLHLEFFSADFVANSTVDIVSFFTQANGGMVLCLEVGHLPGEKIGKLITLVCAYKCVFNTCWLL